MRDAEPQNPTSGVTRKDGSEQFEARRREFRALHEGGCFVTPNPWDVGPALALAAWGGFTRAAQALKSDGSFAGFAGLAPFADINNFLAADHRTRGM